MKTVFCCLFFSSFGHAMYLFCLLDIVDRDMEDILVCIYALCPTVALFRHRQCTIFTHSTNARDTQRNKIIIYIFDSIGKTEMIVCIVSVILYINMTVIFLYFKYVGHSGLKKTQMNS